MNPTDELLFEDNWAAGGEPGDEHLSDIPGTCPVCCEVLGADAVEVRTTFGVSLVCPGCDLPPAPRAPRSTTMSEIHHTPAPPRGARLGAPAMALLLASMATAQERRCGFCGSRFEGHGALCDSCAVELRAVARTVLARHGVTSPTLGSGSALAAVREAFALARARAQVRRAAATAWPWGGSFT